MRKPNTSLRGYEAPSLRPPDCGYRLADCTLLMADTRRREGGPSRLTGCCRPASPQNLQHWMKERPEMLQAIHTDLSLLRKSNTSKNKYLGGSPSQRYYSIECVSRQ